MQSITHKIGALSGSGNLTGSNTWVIGVKNVNKTFAGVISAGSVKKTGSGVQTFSGANTYTGGTTIEQGSLNVTNTSGSGTGTGSISITGSSAEKYGSLGGSGIVTGAVTITGYGAIDISDNNYSTLQTGKITMSSDNASFKVKVNPVAGTTGCVKTTSIAVKGKLIITNDSFRKLREGNVFKIGRAHV